MGGALQSYFCLWVAEIFRNLKARGKVFLEMEGTHGAMNTVGTQQVSRTREGRGPLPCPNGLPSFIPQESGIRSSGRLNHLPQPALHPLEGGSAGKIKPVCIFGRI